MRCWATARSRFQISMQCLINREPSRGFNQYASIGNLFFCYSQRTPHLGWSQHLPVPSTSVTELTCSDAPVEASFSQEVISFPVSILNLEPETSFGSLHSLTGAVPYSSSRIFSVPFET